MDELVDRFARSADRRRRRRMTTVELRRELARLQSSLLRSRLRAQREPPRRRSGSSPTQCSRATASRAIRWSRTKVLAASASATDSLDTSTVMLGGRRANTICAASSTYGRVLRSSVPVHRRDVCPRVSSSSGSTATMSHAHVTMQLSATHAFGEEAPGAQGRRSSMAVGTGRSLRATNNTNNTNNAREADRSRPGSNVPVVTAAGGPHQVDGRLGRRGTFAPCQRNDGEVRWHRQAETREERPCW